MLGPLQRSMVLASMRSPHAGLYVVQDVCDIPGPLDAELLHESWRQVARRHPALRASVEMAADAEPRLRVQDDPEIEWQHLDWSMVSASESDTQLAELLRSDWARGFPFDDEVPMRFTLLRRGSDRHTLIWTSHHVLLDGRSYLIVWREWFALYEGLLRGEDAELARPAFGFEAAQHESDGSAESYWRGQLAGLTQTTGYVVDRIRGASPDAREGIIKESRSLSDEQTQRLREFAAHHGITINTLIQGAWALILSRYSGRSEVVFGVTSAGRPADAAHASEWVGVFIKTLPMRVTIAPDEPTLAWLEQLRSLWVEMRRHEDAPLEQIREWSGLPPGTPLFDTMLVYDHQPPGEWLRKMGGGWEQRTLRRLQRTDSPLTLAAYGAPRVTLDLIYDASLFDRRTVIGMMGHLETLLLSFAERPDGKLCELRILPEEEEAWLVKGVNQTATSYDRSLCAHRLFEQQAQENPSNIALDDRGKVVTYREANQRANQLAWFLREQGAGPEDRVAICMDRSPEVVIAVMAALKAGAAFLPIDPNLPPERLQTMLEDAQPKLVLCQDAHFSKFSTQGHNVLNLSQYEDEIKRQSADDLPDIATAGNAAYTIYTSGSTGKPKAVVMTHRSLVNHTLAVTGVFEITSADRRLQFASIGSDVFVAEVFNYLSSGAALVFGAKREGQSLREFLQLLEEQKITIAGIPSTWWQEWVAALSTASFALPTALRAVIVGMERVDPAAFATWKRMAGTHVRWFNAYGPTESLTTTIYEAGSSEWESGPFVSIGKSIANLRTYVLDSAGDLAPMGIPGELHVGGDGVARGYWNAPELTARKFIADRFNEDPGRRLYRTGDLVFRLPDGNLVFVGRVDRQVKVRGFRVELEEIEAALAEHPAVKQCAVVLDAEAKLVAYLTANDGQSPALQQLRSHLSRRLPGHMIPSAFVVLENMPRTPSGKIDLQALPSDGTGQLKPSPSFQEPTTATEKRLAGLWQQALGENLRIGATDDFFELGGDSLRATILITLIHTEFGAEVSLGSLLRAPTIADLASILEGHEPAVQETELPESITPLRSHGTRIPFFGIPASGFDPLTFRQLAQHLGDDQPFFALDNPVWMDGRMLTVEELASRACSLVRKVKPTGPYLLGGYCFGGLVAYEAARQLTSAGDDVLLLALFDTIRPGHPKLFRSPSYFWQRFREGKISLRFEPRSAMESIGFGGTLLARRAIALVNRMLRRRGVAPVATAGADEYGLMGRSGSMYVPGPINVPVAQFIAEDEPMSTRLLEDPRLAWPELCRSGFHLYHLPGTHGEFPSGQYAEQAAVALTELLRAANPK
jgi:amino acid adenylation domain-containing protein